MSENTQTQRKSSRSNDDDGQESLTTRSFQYLYRGFVARVRSVLVWKYGKRGQSMPPVAEPLLLESATTIAEKIRTKQVISTGKLWILRDKK